MWSLIEWDNHARIFILAEHIGSVGGRAGALITVIFNVELGSGD